MVTLPLNTVDGNHTAKIARLSVLSSFSRLTMAFNQIVLPLFVLAIGLDEAFYGFMVAAAGYVQGVVLFPAGIFSDKKGRGVAILLGGLGIHKFYLGYTKEGVIQLILGLACGIGAIIGLVEGILYLTKSDEEFVATYVTGQKGWF